MIGLCSALTLLRRTKCEFNIQTFDEEDRHISVTGRQTDGQMDRRNNCTYMLHARFARCNVGAL